MIDDCLIKKKLVENTQVMCENDVLNKIKKIFDNIL
jgi:hypothetical protein